MITAYGVALVVALGGSAPQTGPAPIERIPEHNYDCVVDIQDTGVPILVSHTDKNFGFLIKSNHRRFIDRHNTGYIDAISTPAVDGDDESTITVYEVGKFDPKMRASVQLVFIGLVDKIVDALNNGDCIQQKTP